MDPDPEEPISRLSSSSSNSTAPPRPKGPQSQRRFFFRQAFEIYGGVGGFFTYGPPGAAIKQNLITLWRNHFVIEENLLEIDDTCIMPHEVLFTSGHVERFNDFIVKDSVVRPHPTWRRPRPRRACEPDYGANVAVRVREGGRDELSCT